MVTVTAYLSLNVEIVTPAGAAARSRPLLNLTPLVASYYTAKARTRRLGRQARRWLGPVATVAAVAAIGFSAAGFALGVTR